MCLCLKQEIDSLPLQTGTEASIYFGSINSKKSFFQGNKEERNEYATQKTKSQLVFLMLYLELDLPKAK